MNETPAQSCELKAFDAIIGRLQSAVNEADSISDGLYSKANILLPFSPEIYMKDSQMNDSPPGDWIIYRLNELVVKFSFINQRNRDTLKHLNTLI
jgi:hypothetical protein